ncbi:MAG: hypothetical protein QNK20_07640 [Aureibaculum sp.]|nr:hypothetical protein [Aureibaculum sp.]
MKKLLERIAELESISAELEPNQLQREKYNSEINMYADDFINSLIIRPAYTKGNTNNPSLSIKQQMQSQTSLLEIYCSSC